MLPDPPSSLAHSALGRNSMTALRALATPLLVRDIRNDVHEKYDTSDYPADHASQLPRVNKKVIGLMKDEAKQLTTLKSAKELKNLL